MVTCTIVHYLFFLLVRRQPRSTLFPYTTLFRSLVEVGVPGHLAERPHLDAGRLHVDQEVADAVVLRLVRLAADQGEHPVGLARARGPDLLAVHDPRVALEHGAGAERGQVAPRPRLAVALAPADLPEQGARDEALLLRLGPVLEEGRHEHARPLADHLVGSAGAAELLGDDGRLEGVGRLLAAAVAPGDVAVEVAALDRLQAERGRSLVQGDRPREGGHAVRVGLAGGVLAAPVLGEKAAHLGAEVLVLGAVLEVHGRVLPDAVGRLLTASGALSRAARSPRSGQSPSRRSGDRPARRPGCAARRRRGRGARAGRRCRATPGSSRRTDPGAGPRPSARLIAPGGAA